MNNEDMELIFSIGETIAVEFKRCGNGIESDTYETVCSFLNRFGGDIYLGVEDHGEVRGIPPKAVDDLIKNFIKIISNPDNINPTVYLSPKAITYKDRTIIHIRVFPSSEVHTYRKVIYDRVDDSDVKVTATGQIAQMYIRKQKIYTEKKVYPYFEDEHFRFDMLPRVKQMALNRYQAHPWKDLSDSQLLQSAGLIGKDWETGKRGYNLATVMLLGRDEIIKDVCPTYRTDALVRKVNINRYDDRLIVETNLIESYEQLMMFAEKHLPDKFHLEDDARFSLRNAICREILVNTLMHRELTSSYIAKFVIEKDKMTTSNANRAEHGGSINPDDFEPNPKNPIIASFFRNIGLADELGSGVRNLNNYVPKYSGKPPELVEGDIFRTIVPLDEEYSYYGSPIKAQYKAQLKHTGDKDCALTEDMILKLLKSNPSATQVEIAESIGITRRGVQEAIGRLKDKEVLTREGSKKNGRWVVNELTE